MKQGNGIKSAALALAMTLSVPLNAWAISPEFAYTTEEWARLRDNTMEYSELTGLVHEYNVTVINNRVSYKDFRSKTRDEISQDYRDAADTLRSNAVYPDDSESPGYASMYVAAQMAEAQATQMDKMADDNINDGDIIKMQYDQVEATMASTVQNMMNSYNQLLVTRSSIDSSRELLSTTYESTVTRANLGMATQMDVLNAQEELQKIDASKIELENNIRKLKQNLCVMTGWNYNADPEIQTVPVSDITRIDGMNPENDKAAAIANNYTQNVNKRKLENSSQYFNKEILQKTILDDRQKIGAALTNQYNAVIQAKTAYDQAVSELALETKSMEIAERKYALGSISRLEYLQQKNAFSQKQTNQQLKDMALFQAMETYDWAVKGLLSLS